MPETFGELADAGTLRFTRVLPGPIERVWAFLTEPDKRATWLAGGDWDLRPGGRADLVFDNARLCRPGDAPPAEHAGSAGEVAFAGEVIRVEPPRLLVLSWSEDDGSASVVRFELEPAGDDVRLTLTHAGLSEGPARLGVAAGWHTHLDIWKAKAEGEAAPSFWESHTRLERAYARRIAAP